MSNWQNSEYRTALTVAIMRTRSMSKLMTEQRILFAVVAVIAILAAGSFIANMWGM